MMAKFARKARKGFTLVEIMIVVLIIGILLAIAVPNFIKARETSRKNSCIANLKQIDSATEQWAMDTKKATGDAVTAGDVLPYLKGAAIVTCPTDNSAYVLTTVGANPTCPNSADGHVLP